MTTVQPVRRPLDGLSPYDTDAVIRWALQRAFDEILRSATVRPRLVLVLDDHLAEVDLLEQAAGDPVATLLALGGRSDIEHRLLFGCHDDGDGWTAWVFGAANDEQRSFWLATTPFEVRPGGLGAGPGSWDVAFGVELGPIPFPAAALARDQPAMELLPARPPETLRIEAATHDIPAGVQAPRDAVSATNAVSQMGFEDRAWKQGVEGTIVVIFRERTFDEWRISGDIPIGLDDLIRNLCLHGGAAVAVVALSMDLFPFEGQHLRAVKMVAEAAGTRFERLLALLWSEGDTDQPSHLRYFGSAPREIGSDGWIGVPPITEVDLFPTGPGD